MNSCSREEACLILAIQEFLQDMCPSSDSVVEMTKAHDSNGWLFDVFYGGQEGSVRVQLRRAGIDFIIYFIARSALVRYSKESISTLDVRHLDYTDELKVEVGKLFKRGLQCLHSQSRLLEM